MLSKRYESTEVDRRTWLHVQSGAHWSTNSNTECRIYFELVESFGLILRNVH